jgi:hypothetical protein
VLMILAANSRPVDFCTHLRTTENAPLKATNKKCNVNINVHYITTLYYFSICFINVLSISYLCACVLLENLVCNMKI